MPMQWTPEADAKLLSNIFQICDVKVSGPQMKDIAEAMGNDCTVKAITHRIAKFRAGGGAGTKSTGGGDNEAAPKAKTTKAVKAATGTKKGGKGGKKARTEATPSPGVEGEGEDGVLTPPDTGNGKRKRGVSAVAEGEEEEGDGVKKVKTEQDADADGVEGEAEIEA